MCFSLPFSLILCPLYLFFHRLIPLSNTSAIYKNKHTYSLSKTIFDWSLIFFFCFTIYHLYINASYKQLQQQQQNQQNVKREQNGLSTFERVHKKWGEKMVQHINLSAFICDIIICVRSRFTDITWASETWMVFISHKLCVSRRQPTYNMQCKLNMITIALFHIFFLS